VDTGRNSGSTDFVTGFSSETADAATISGSFVSATSATVFEESFLLFRTQSHHKSPRSRRPITTIPMMKPACSPVDNESNQEVETGIGTHAVPSKEVPDGHWVRRK